MWRHCSQLTRHLHGALPDARPSVTHLSEKHFTLSAVYWLRFAALQNDYALTLVWHSGTQTLQHTRADGAMERISIDTESSFTHAKHSGHCLGRHGWCSAKFWCATSDSKALSMTRCSRCPRA